MKSFLIIFAFMLLKSNLFASLQTQTSQGKAEEQGFLKLAETQTRTIAPERIHVWSLALEMGQYTAVEVLQKGIDVVVRVVDPNGAQKNEFDSPIGISGIEKASWIPKLAGTWKVEIVPLEAKQVGEYEIKWMVQREATEIDQQTVKADSLNNLANLYRAQDKYAEAESLFKQSLAIREKVLGREHLDVLLSFDNLAGLYWKQGEYAKAEPLLRQSLEIREKNLGPMHSDVATDLNNLAEIYYQQGKYVEAESLYIRSLSIRKKIREIDHPEIAESFNNLAALYIAEGNYTKAESLAKQALMIDEKAFGPDDRKVGIDLNNLAMLYNAQGKYSDAKPHLKRSLTILEKITGSNHEEVAVSLNNLAELYRNLGKYAEAESLYHQSLKIYEQSIGPNHPYVAAALNNLAILYMTTGEYAKAEPLIKRALMIDEETFGPDHPNVATDLNSLATLYRIQGKYADAETLSKRILVILEKFLGPDHPTVAHSIYNLASLFGEQGKHSEAESLCEQALKIYEKAFGANHPDVAETLGALIEYLRRQGKYTEAKPLFHRYLIILEKALEPEYPQLAVSLINQAENLFDVSEEKLEIPSPLIERAFRILNVSGGYPDWRVDAYVLRARLRKQKGDFDGALADLAEALRSTERRRPQVGGSEETQAIFLERHINHFKRMVAWQIEAGQMEKALEYAERGSARVLLDLLATSQIDLRSSIPADIRTHLEKREIDAKARLSEYQQRITLLRSRKDLSDKEKQNQIAALQDSLRIADRDYQQVYEEIKNASPLWRNVITSSGQPVALTTLQRELIPTNGLMLLYKIGKEESYLFIIPPDGQQPEALSLQVTDKTASILGVKPGPLKSIDLHKILTGSKDSSKAQIGLRQYLSSSPDSITASQKRSAETRLQALWQVLVLDTIWLRVKACAEVILIPDGALHLLPFEALVTQIGSTRSDLRYWLDEGPIIRYAPSATSLYSFEQRKPAPTNHGQDETVVSLAFAIFDVEGQKSNSDGPRGRFESASEPLQPLPWTKEETNGIREAFQASKGKETVRILLGRDATEHNLRTAMPGKYYVHIATHGLVEEKRQDSFIALALTPPSSTETPVVENDGFLRLNEIYELKIPTCELAVLSACETNVGPSFEGEGVFALSRGFLAAGAHRVVASQWKVQDKSTARLMGTFFQKIAAAEKTGEQIEYTRALRDAKRELRKKKPAPYFWAPFIIMGKR